MNRKKCIFKTIIKCDKSTDIKHFTLYKNLEINSFLVDFLHRFPLKVSINLFKKYDGAYFVLTYEGNREITHPLINTYTCISYKHVYTYTYSIYLKKLIQTKFSINFNLCFFVKPLASKPRRGKSSLPKRIGISLSRTGGLVGTLVQRTRSAIPSSVFSGRSHLLSARSSSFGV